MSLLLENWLAKLLLLIIALAMSSGVAYYQYQYQVQQIEAQFQYDVKQVIAPRLTAQSAAAKAVTTSLGSFHQGADEITSTAFSTITSSLISSYDFIDNVYYAPLVFADEKDAFLKEQKEKGMSHFKVLHYDKWNKLTESIEPQDRYLPILFIEPASYLFTKLYGLDLLSVGKQELVSAIHAAAESGKVIITLSTDLFNQLPSYVFIKAIYSGMQVPKDASERMEQYSGVYIVTISLDSLLKPLKQQFANTIIKLQSAETEMREESGEDALEWMTHIVPIDFTEQTRLVVVRPIVKDDILWSQVGFVFIFLFSMLFTAFHVGFKNKRKNEELLSMASLLDKYVISSETDFNGIIVYASQAMCHVSGYEEKELIGHTHAILRHPDMPSHLFQDLWQTIIAGNTWHGEIKHRKKNGDSYWVDVVISPKKVNNKIVGYRAIRQDITAKKMVEAFSATLEQEVLERTEALANSMIFMKQLLNSIPNPIFYKDEYGRFLGFNKAYEATFAVNSRDLIGRSVLALDYLPLKDREMYHQEDMQLIQKLSALQREQDMIFYDNQVHNTLYSVNSFAKSDGSPGGLIGIFTDITPQKEMEAHLREIHRQIRDSIEYGSLIQHTLLPDPDLFEAYFPESFIYWEPKDTVGGDIYFLESLGNDDECFLMMVDCTGHGVPGAFVTMLVKAIERHLMARLVNSQEAMSPAEVLSIFNKSMRHLLKQDCADTCANAGFDGCIVYLNKRTGNLVFSGAETSLFYRTDTQGVTEIKGNRHSIGYRQSDNSYVFTDHALTIESGMQVYLTTDGYLDQNGGEKSFPLGKKRFIKLVEACQTLPLSEQKTYFMEQLALYQGNNDRNDDVTLLSFRF